MKTIICFLKLAFSLLGNIGNMRKIKAMDEKGIKDERENFVFQVTSKWAKSMVDCTGSEVEVFGEENLIKDRPVVYISNHQSDYDIPLFMGYIRAPKGFIAKTEMLKVPFVRDWMQVLHCVFMDRSNVRKAASAIIEGVKILKDGHSLVIFPEGTRSRSSEMLEFKAGSFKLATKAKVPIIPVTMDGSYKIFEGNGNKIKSAKVKIHIHPAIETDGLSKEAAENLPVEIKNIIASKLK